MERWEQEWKWTSPNLWEFDDWTHNNCTCATEFSKLYKGCLESSAARNLIKFNCFTSVDTVWSLIVIWLLHWDLRVSTYFDLILRINVSLSSLFSIMSSTDYANANLKSYLQGKYTDWPSAVLWQVLWHVWYSQIKYDFPWM